MPSDTGSAGLSYQAFDQAQRKLAGAAAICLNNTDWCSRNLLTNLQPDSVAYLYVQTLAFVLVKKKKKSCVRLPCAFWKLMYFDILKTFQQKFRDFLLCLSRTVNTVFMCFLSSRARALCHGLNKDNTITGCKWASPYTWNPLLFHTRLISLLVPKWKQMHRAAWSFQ